MQPNLGTAQPSPIYTYFRGGAGFLLCRGNQVICETATVSDMLAYLKQHGIRDCEYRTTRIAVFR